MVKVETIACKCGNVFSACGISHIDTEWEINREVYRLQGCLIQEQDADAFKFNIDKNCCEQRANLFHMDSLLEAFRDEILEEFYDEEEADDDDDDDDYFDDEEE